MYGVLTLVCASLLRSDLQYRSYNIRSSTSIFLPKIDFMYRKMHLYKKSSPSNFRNLPEVKAPEFAKPKIIRKVWITLLISTVSIEQLFQGLPSTLEN